MEGYDEMVDMLDLESSALRVRVRISLALQSKIIKIIEIWLIN